MSTIHERVRPGRLRWRIMMASITVAATLPLFLSLATTTPAMAQDSPNWQKIYNLTDDPANCVDDSWNNGYYNFFRVNRCISEDAQQFSYNTTTSQVVAGLGSGYYCMTVVPGETGDGSNLILWPCSDTGAWSTWEQRDGNGGLLYNPQSGLCLDDTGSGGPGTFLELWNCTGQSNQDFWIAGYYSS
jgi:hypothetical protein